MKKGYLDLINKKIDLNDFVIDIIKVWFEFYNLVFENKDKAELTSL